MVMLDLHFANGLLFGGVATAEVIRMQVTGDDFGPDFKDALQMGDRLLEKVQCDHVFKIPDMLAQKRFVAFGDADGIFQLGTAGQDLRNRAV
jgi:hypothetical protein